MSTGYVTDEQHQKLIAILARPKGEELLLLFLGRKNLRKALQLHNSGKPIHRLTQRVLRQVHEAVTNVR
jgi:hypothetical protein